MSPPSDPQTSDLVQEARLEALQLSPTLTQHTFYQRGTSGREWKIRVHETWKREKRLGQGAYGIVWLETCDRPARKHGPVVRAVKEITIDSTAPGNMDYYRELEAVMKFSQDRVRGNRMMMVISDSRAFTDPYSTRLPL